VSQPYETYAEEVGADAVAAYVAATDDANPCYRGADAVAPPLYLVTLSVPRGLLPVVSDPDVIGDPTRLLSLLHAEEEVRFFRPVRVGEGWRITPRLVTRSETSTGELLVVGTSVTDAAGTPVAETRSHLLIRDRKPQRPMRESSKSEAPPAQAPVWSRRFDVAPDQSLRYAEASGDRNPIHTDDDVARMVGLKGKILHGLCTMAFVQRAVIDTALGGDPRRLGRLRVRFAKPVYNGDALTVSAWERRTDAGVLLDLLVTNQDGQVVIADGEAELRGEL